MSPHGQLSPLRAHRHYGRDAELNRRHGKFRGERWGCRGGVVVKVISPPSRLSALPGHSGVRRTQRKYGASQTIVCTIKFEVLLSIQEMKLASDGKRRSCWSNTAPLMYNGLTTALYHRIIRDRPALVGMGRSIPDRFDFDQVGAFRLPVFEVH